MPNKRVELTDEEITEIKEIVSFCEKEDDEIRKSQVKIWKRNLEYWRGVQMIFWSERDSSWLAPKDVNLHEFFSEEEIAEFGPIYDYVVDIYKAHGESIIAALSSNVPALRFRPDDADNESDRMTAKTFSTIADLLYIHNKARLMLIEALYHLYNEGIVASYRYTESDPSFGTVKIPIYSQPLDATASSDATASTPVKVGEKDEPKTRTRFEIFGPLHVKISIHAKNQAALGYLVFKSEQSKSLVKSMWPKKEDDIDGSHMENMDRFTRSVYSYPYDVDLEQSDLTTVTKVWLRPWMLWRISKDKADIRKSLQKKFESGVHVVFVGKRKEFLEAWDESMDDRWEIGQSGPSDLIHSNPYATPLIPIQDMRNELINLTMDTIDHGIPASFADSEVINFDQYGMFEALPGYVYKATPKPNQSLKDAFASEPRATLSKEVPMLFRQLDQDGQFSLGSFPSIFGGPSEGKSRTFAEYSMSRQMALQRLTLLWLYVLDWWSRTIHGGVKMYVESLIGDDSYTKFENNSYVNVWIRRSELEGKVGGVEPEVAENFPITSMQRKETILKLLEMNNPYINSALYQPNNAKLIADAISLSDFQLPGDDQRIKQAREINELMKGEPVDGGDGQLVPTIQPEPNVDDAQVHISVCKCFLVSTVGLDLKQYNPAGYMNIVAHMKLHQRDLVMQTMAAHEATPPGAPPDTAAISATEES